MNAFLSVQKGQQASEGRTKVSLDWAWIPFNILFKDAAIVENLAIKRL